MKRPTFSLKTAIAVLAAAAAFGAQADTQNLTVNATVQSVCKFTGAAQTLSFDIDPSLTGNASGTLSAPITYKCSNGVTTAAVSAGNGAHWSGSTRQMSTGGTTPSLLPYALTVTGSANGSGFGSAVTANTVTVTGTVAQADYQNATASTAYTDTVVLTLTP